MYTELEMASKAEQLAEEMTRFEQEILGNRNTTTSTSGHLVRTLPLLKPELHVPPPPYPTSGYNSAPTMLLPRVPPPPPPLQVQLRGISPQPSMFTPPHRPPVNPQSQIISRISAGPAMAVHPPMPRPMPPHPSMKLMSPMVPSPFVAHNASRVTIPSVPVKEPKPATASEDDSVGMSRLPLKPPKKKIDKKKLRVGGGQAWRDSSLDDWDPNDFRVFVGDLGNDVNDDTLARAFSKYPTFLKAKVIRDKYTKKTKGYGFVSFKDPHDFMQAMREMNGRYIGNRPVKLRKSMWRDRCFDVAKKKDKEKKRLGFK